MKSFFIIDTLDKILKIVKCLICHRRSYRRSLGDDEFDGMDDIRIDDFGIDDFSEDEFLGDEDNLLDFGDIADIGEEIIVLFVAFLCRASMENL